MCKSYKGFGLFSILIGAMFAGFMLIFGFNMVRIAVAVFFLILGTIDILLYSKYGEG